MRISIYAEVTRPYLSIVHIYTACRGTLSEAPGRRENTNRVRGARVNNGEFVKPPIHLRGTRACRSRRQPNTSLEPRYVASHGADSFRPASSSTTTKTTTTTGIKAKRTVGGARSRLSESEYKAKALSAFPVGTSSRRWGRSRDP